MLLWSFLLTPCCTMNVQEPSSAPLKPFLLPLRSSCEYAEYLEQSGAIRTRPSYWSKAQAWGMYVVKLEAGVSVNVSAISLHWRGHSGQLTGVA